MHIAASKGFVEIMRCLSDGKHAAVSVNVASKVRTNMTPTGDGRGSKHAPTVEHPPHMRVPIHHAYDISPGCQFS